MNALELSRTLEARKLGWPPVFTDSCEDAFHHPYLLSLGMQNPVSGHREHCSKSIRRGACHHGVKEEERIQTCVNQEGVFRLGRVLCRK